MGLRWVMALLMALSAAGAGPIEGPNGFYWPTEAVCTTDGQETINGRTLTGVWLSGWGNTDYTDDGSKYHLAKDIPGAAGDPVYAVADGQVVDVSPGGWGDGNRAIVMQHGSPEHPYRVIYGHVRLADGSAWAGERQAEKAQLPAGTIPAGTVIARLGPYSTVDHLHLAVAPGSGQLRCYGTADNPSPLPAEPLLHGLVAPIAFLQRHRPDGSSIDQPAPGEAAPEPLPLPGGGPTPLDWSQTLGEPQELGGDRILFSAGGLIATTEGGALFGERVTVYTAGGVKVFGPVDGWGEAFSPTDELFAYGTGKLGQYTTILVQLPDGETVGSVSGNEATFSPDGRWLAAVEGTPLGGQTTHVYRVPDPTAVQTIQGGKPTWSPDGRFLATSTKGTTWLWSQP